MGQVSSNTFAVFIQLSFLFSKQLNDGISYLADALIPKLNKILNLSQITIDRSWHLH